MTEIEGRDRQMDPLEQLVELFAAEEEEIRPRIAPRDLIRVWRRACDGSNWQKIMFADNSAESEGMMFDEIDRVSGVPIGTLKEAWAMARNRAGQT